MRYLLSLNFSSLEAILTYLKDQKIKVNVVGVGNLNKKDVIKMQIYIHNLRINKKKIWLYNVLIIKFYQKLHNMQINMDLKF